MGNANERQVGGKHYKGAEYQHWDYANDLRLPYLVGYATRYVARHRRKNGREDIEKALHTVDKIMEVRVSLIPIAPEVRAAVFWRFVLSNKLELPDCAAIWHLQEGEWDAAKRHLQATLEGLYSVQGTDS